jgi:hypothetical protein
VFGFIIISIIINTGTLVQRPSIRRPIAGIGFRDPALPLALAPAVRFSGVESGWPQLSDQQQTLIELGLPYGVLPSIF